METDERGAKAAIYGLNRAGGHNARDRRSMDRLRAGARGRSGAGGCRRAAGTA
jgi:hypothetical protein